MKCLHRSTISMLLACLLAGSALTASGCATEVESQREVKKKAEYHYQLAAGYFKEQLIPQAIRELILAVEADPEMAQAHHLLAFVYMGRRDYDKAIHHYKLALEIKPDYYICINNLGTAYLAAKRWPEAIDLYENLSGNPMYNTPELAHNNLGWAYYNNGQADRARQSFEMAVFLKPQMCLAHNNLGMVKSEQGNAISAARSFRQAIEGCPTYAEPNFHLAQLLRTRQDPDARFYYQRCYDLAANSNWGDRCASYLNVVP